MKKYLLILLVSVLLTGCGQSQASEADLTPTGAVDPTPTEEPTPTAEPTDTPTPFPSLPPIEQAEAVIELIEPICKEAYGDNYELSVFQDDTVRLDLWYEGLDLLIAWEKSGMEDVGDFSWDEWKEDIVGLNMDILDDAKRLDCPDINVSVNICDSNNHDKSLLITFNGDIVFDVEENM